MVNLSTTERKNVRVLRCSLWLAALQTSPLAYAITTNTTSQPDKSSSIAGLTKSSFRAMAAAAVRPVVSDNDIRAFDFPTRRNRMVDQPSLAEQFMSLTNEKPSDFTDRLLQEGKRNSNRQVNYFFAFKEAPKFWIAAIGSTVVVAILTCLLSPSLIPLQEGGHMALSTASSALAVSPWILKGGFSKQAGAIIVEIMAVVQLLSRHSVQEYIKENIFPTALSTLKKMLLMEVWSRIWKSIGKHILKLKEDQHGDGTWKNMFPSWLTHIHSFLHSSVNRFTKSMVKKKIQGRVESVILQVFETVAKQIESGAKSVLVEKQPLFEAIIAS